MQLCLLILNMATKDSLVEGKVIVNRKQSSRLISNSGLIDEALDRILDILAQIGVYRKSPKFFIIYTHENEKFPEYKAHSTLVQSFIK